MEGTEREETEKDDTSKARFFRTVKRPKFLGVNKGDLKFESEKEFVTP